MADRPATPRTTALVRSGKSRLTRQLVGRQLTSGDDVWQVLVDATHRAVLVHDAAGVVQVVSASATELFPGLVPGAQLAEVPDFNAKGSEPFEVERTGVLWRWHSEQLDAEHMAWHGEIADDDAEPWCENCAWSRFLANASRLLTGSLDRDRTLRAIVQLAVPMLADCCAVLLPAPRGRLEWWRFTRGGDTARGRIGHYALESLVDLPEAFSAPEARLTRTELAPGPRPDWLLPVEFGAVGGLVVAPMRHGEHAVGALVLANGKRRGPVDPNRFDEMRDYAIRAATALSQVAAYTAQAEAAAILESDLIPGPLPEVPGTLLAAAYRPAKEAVRVGGDFYEVYPGDDGSALFMLGDVAGNGVEAAALAGRIEHSVAALRLVESRPAALLYLLNQTILGNSANRFATLVVGSLSRHDDGKLELVLASGGHPPPVVLRADGTVQEVVMPGTLVGVLPEPRFSEATVLLAPGDVCLLYSDGVTEARGGQDGQELFGPQRLGEAMAGGAGMSAAELTGHIERRLERWLGGREHDDIAMLAVQAS
ncbi:MAG TPA: SpoIIE family protein phosphatase [Pseudonocardiaceae bacterium]|nr:SpoIIE family protein phosphatase [Pseudonocardiaceae bacterium]